MAEKALDAINGLIERYNDSIYKDLEKYANEHWGEWVSDKGNYETIKLSPDQTSKYIDVLDSDGSSWFESLNTDHRVLLGLNLLSALIRINKDNWSEDFPLVFDAPLSELGASSIPQALNGFGSTFSQVILMLKDGSIPPLEGKFKEKLGKHYQIEYDSERTCSTIKEI